MKKLMLSLFFMAPLISIAAHAEEAVCHRCEEIREYNKTHHKNYEYYEDYLKDCEAPTMCKPEKKPVSKAQQAAPQTKATQNTAERAKQSPQ